MRVLEMPEAERASYLDIACKDDAILRQEVDELMALDVDQSFMALSPVGIDLPAIEDKQPLQGQIGRIRIDRLIASGGMGEVYAGIDDLLERPVAIKVIQSGQRLSAFSRTAFLNEARVLSGLKHPNICEVHDFFEDRERDVLVMELIEGQTLRDSMKATTLSRPLLLARQIVSALASAHERGIVHRDLKPENIMLTENGQIKILDFGLARSNTIMADIPSADDDPAPTLKTRISGTPGYMSPEQARGEVSTSATDLWSFGLVLSELLTGQKPYPAGTATPELIERARSADVNIPRQLPQAEKALIQALLSEQPEQRPSARDVLQRIDRILDRPRRRAVWAAFAAVLALSGLGLWKYTSDLKQEQELAVAATERAEQARSEAEDLIGFLVEDLNRGLREVGRLDLLESVADQALGYYGELSPEEMSRSDGQPAVALQRVAQVIDSQGDIPRAITIMRQPIEGLTYLIDSEPDNALALFRLGTAHSYMGDLMRTEGHFMEARAHTSTAMEIGRELTQGLEPGEGPSARPNAEERWRVLLRSTYIHADTFMRMGDNDRTVEFLEQAAALAVPAVVKQPGLTTNLADIQFKRCDTYYDMALKELALEACLASLEMDRQLHLAKPDDYWAHKNFALDHMVVARVYRSLGRPDEGLAIANIGAEHTQQLLDWEPDNATRINDHITMMVTRGQMLRAMGDQEQSQQLFQQAHDRIQSFEQTRDDIPFLNNTFLTRLYVGEIEQAREVAAILAERGFKRREFRELCAEFNIAECGLN